MENTNNPLTPAPETEPTIYCSKILSLTPVAAAMGAIVKQSDGSSLRLDVICFALIRKYGDIHDATSDYEEVEPVFLFDGALCPFSDIYSSSDKISELFFTGA